MIFLFQRIVSLLRGVELACLDIANAARKLLERDHCLVHIFVELRQKPLVRTADVEAEVLDLR